MATAAAVLLQQVTDAIVRRFDEAGADAPERAIAFLPTNRDQRWMLKGLIRRGAIATTAAGDYWLDRAALARNRRREKRQAAVVIGGFLAVAALALALG